MRLAADMHIHTVLSPCASREMTPPAIVREAARKGLAVIAVCDHNSAGNVRAVAAGRRRDPGRALPSSPGIEITTVEEVHVLGLFRDPATRAPLPTRSPQAFPPGGRLRRARRCRGGSRRQPEQQLMDAAGNVTGIETRMLAAASWFTLSGAVDLIHRHGGLAVAAHVDRRSFSVPGQLGFIPPDVPFDGLEISAAGAARGRAADFAAHGLPLVSSSDCHFLEDIGSGLHGAGRGGAVVRRDRQGAAGWSREGGARLREISLHILDLIENCHPGRRHASSPSPWRRSPSSDLLCVSVEDNGPGLARAGGDGRRPVLHHQGREEDGAGAEPAEVPRRAGRGELPPGEVLLGGLAVRATMPLSNVDRSPLGDLAATLASVVCTNPEVELRSRLRVGSREWSVSTADIARALPVGGRSEIAVARRMRENESRRASRPSMCRNKQEEGRTA